MEHKFNVKAATEVGVPSAVILWYFHEATKAAKTLGDNFFDGRSWVRASVSMLTKKYPYFSKGQIRRAIDKLLKDGYVIAGNYNNYGQDMTSWYALTDTGYELMERE